VKENGENGFILVAVLWFAALLALAAVVIEAWVSSALDRGAALDERVATQAALITAEQRAAFLLVTGSASPRGIELRPHPASAAEAPAGETEAPFSGPFVALDNRAYHVGRTVVRLQDGGGLYDINNPDHAVLGHLLKSFGLADSDREALARSLLTYESRENETTAGDDAGVRQTGLPLPRHARLLTPWELLRVPGWRGEDRLWRLSSPLPAMLTLGPNGGLNINTASAQMLTALGGLNEREAASLVASRAARPIRNLRDFGAAAGRGDEDRSLDVMPSNVIRLQLALPDEPLLRTIEERVTPEGKAPIRTDYVVDLPSQAAGGELNDAPPLPELSAPADAATPP
jgi:hypothetical protein